MESWYVLGNNAYGHGQPAKCISNCLIRLRFADVIIAFNIQTFSPITAFHPDIRIRYFAYASDSLWTILIFAIPNSDVQWYGFTQNGREFFPSIWTVTGARFCLDLFFIIFLYHFSMVSRLRWPSIKRIFIHLSIFNHHHIFISILRIKKKAAGMSLTLNGIRCVKSNQNYLPQMLLYHQQWNPHRVD